MILVIGGIASGKRTFARSLGFGEGDFTTGVDDGLPVLVDAQELVRFPGARPEDLARRIGEGKQVVLMTDVGSGIVPIDRAERAWRDDAGHLGRFLAERADAVVRMVCGIPVVLKGDLPESRPQRGRGEA